ncbi:spore germination protein [Metabacillus dongyingensis]|uniref:spore germination protein n=1 Tax=Metabacillus dongyingensis TaxID=2874282 RepID=UPI003B8DD301
MPAFVGPIIIESSSGAVSAGDVFALSPKSTSKFSVGSGTLNTGDFMVITDDKSITNFYDFDIIDQPTIFNG